MKEKVRTVMISLEAGPEVVLFVLLGSDGTINRMGTGTAENTEKAMYVGRTLDRLFAKFMAQVDVRLLTHGGRYVLPNPQGQICTLKLLFQLTKAPRSPESIGFEFVYGADSEGPPAQVSDLVIAAVEMTQPWFEEQKRIAGKIKTSGPSDEHDKNEGLDDEDDEDWRTRG